LAKGQKKKKRERLVFEELGEIVDPVKTTGTGSLGRFLKEGPQPTPLAA